MGVPVAHKAECWIAEFAMTESGGQWCGLGARPINGRQGGAVERHGDGRDGPSLSSPEGAPTPPASRLASWRRFSSPGDLRCSTTRSFGYENGEDSECQQYFSPRSEFSQENSDTDSMSTSISRIHSFRSGASSPMDSPVKRLDQRNASPPTRRSSLFSQYSPSYPPNSGGGSEDVDYSFEDPPSHDDEHNQDPPQPIDFESNGLIWYPPPPEDEGDDLENGFFEYDDDDEDDGGDSGEFFRHGNCDGDGDGDDDILGIKGKHNIAHKEFLRNALHGHFKVLVSQLLQGHGVDPADGWLDIVSSLAWQAANFVRPDTSGGGSMDPTNYVKVKCMASGNPNDSTFIRGVVCSKNVKHKRMISQHRNPRLLLLGGALEHQKVTNRLASINSILEQEKEYLKNAVAKIEAQRPHVLLVEKSVPLFAQQLLAKQISLVLNVKKPLLERISHCTGAEIASSIENLASARLGQCQTFRVERITECSSPNNSSKKSVKTLMFFEGCPRRLGCTVLLRGANYEELKKVKLAVQFAVFAAYHLSLETSFLADEGATLPKIPLGLSAPPLEKPIDGGNCPSSYCLEKFSEVQSICDKHTGNRSGSTSPECHDSSLKLLSADEALLGSNPKQKEYNAAVNDVFPCSPTSSLNNGHVPLPDINVQPSASLPGCLKQRRSKDYIRNIQGDEMVNGMFRAESNLDNDWHHISDEEHKGVVVYNHNEHYNEYPQSILVSLSIGCPLSGIVCKQSQLFRIKFYSNVDKPLGRYFHEDLFNQTSCCESCKEPAEAHVRCYTHQQGSLAISVRNLPSVNLPGERDGKIWMWHRCLRCKPKDGIPPATQRVVMSDAARGLSFGKFLELSFSNHTTANRIACCGHSLQRDCLRFYGFGSMVAVFRHSPVDILSVKLPPSILDFSYPIPQEWITKEATAVSNMKECFYREIFDELNCIEKIVATQDGSMKAGMYKHIVDLKDLIKVEQKKYSELFGFASIENLQTLVSCIDILELNRLRQELVLDAYIWERRLYMMQSLAEDNCHNATIGAQCSKKLPGSLLDESKTELSHSHENMGSSLEQIQSSSLTTVANSGKPLLMREQNDTSPILLGCNTNTIGGMPLQPVEGYVGSAGLPFISGQCEAQSEGLLGDGPKLEKALERTQSSASCLSNRIDLAWTCSNQFVNDPTKCGMEALVGRPAATMDFPSFQKAIAPIRIKSFDSAISFRNRLSSIDDAKANIRRAYSQRSPRALERIGRGLSSTFRSRLLLSGMMDSGGRLLLPQNASDVVVAVYDDEPSSMIAHAMTTDEYYDLLFPPVDQHNELDRFGVRNSVDLESTSRSFSCGSLQSSGSDQPQPLSGNISKYVHFTVSFEDEHSCSMDKAKFSVTCYFAKQFDAIRRKCCPNELDYIRSLSRCKRWSAQGGKSNAYFAKTLDDRFVIKQVTRTELDSFEDFAPEYFKYLTESLSGSPTCLAKILGLYQVVAKNLRGGKELKMDVMVMENLFFKRKISRIYDLKGSLRSRYNPDSSGNNKVLLDLNLLETLHTKPIFLGHKAKRRLERAVWNDTSFLASVDVMDYSLLVGIDVERKELVMGIIDYLRQYTWDKQLETWVKTSGILGGPKNTLPTIISPVQYKKRFRKAMSKYFLTVPDQWSS